MDKYFYLDTIEDDYNDDRIRFYKIETDLSFDQLIDFFNKKAKEFCDKEKIEEHDFINVEGGYEYDYHLEIKINDIIKSFSLRSCLQKNILKNKLCKRLNPKSKITLLTEDLL